MVTWCDQSSSCDYSSEEHQPMRTEEMEGCRLPASNQTMQSKKRGWNYLQVIITRLTLFSTIRLTFKNELEPNIKVAKLGMMIAYDDQE